MKLKKIFLVVATTFIFSTAAFAQDAFAVGKDFRAKIKTLMDAKDYQAALALYGQLESGKYTLGDAAAQAGALKITNVGTDKGKLLIAMGKYDDADRAYYQVYDNQLAAAEKALADVANYFKNGTPSGIDATLAKSSLSIARSALSLADSARVQREAQYSLANVKPNAFDQARIARYEALKQRTASYSLS